MKHELQGVVAKIAEWQELHGLSKAEMLRKFADLGSTRTYGKLLNGDYSDIDLEGQLINYSAVLSLIEEMEEAVEELPLIDSLGAVSKVRAAILGAMSNTGNNRVIIVQGQSGIGKTSAVKVMQQRYGSRIIRIEASDVWADKPNALLSSILSALGVQSIPGGVAERFEKCVQLLNMTRRCLVIDEAHHLGKKCLNTVKTLVNTTPGEFVLVAIPTLWSKLESESYLEARQLSTNRLAERVKLDLLQKDVAEYIRRSLPDFPAESIKNAAKLISESAYRMGYFAFVRDVCRLLEREQLHEHKETIQAVSAAIGYVVNKR